MNNNNETAGGGPAVQLPGGGGQPAERAPEGTDRRRDRVLPQLAEHITTLPPHISPSQNNFRSRILAFALIQRWRYSLRVIFERTSSNQRLTASFRSLTLFPSFHSSHEFLHTSFSLLLILSWLLYLKFKAFLQGIQVVYSLSSSSAIIPFAQMPSTSNV